MKSLTRREALKGCLGLAGIIAAQRSPAIMKGLLAASKISQIEEGSTFSAKDYVQDGLIAIWDGIENVGWGKHNSSATRWNSLINSKDYYKIVNGTWNDDSLQCVGNAAFWRTYTQDGLDSAFSPASAEICIRKENDVSYSPIVDFNAGARFLLLSDTKMAFKCETNGSGCIVTTGLASSGWASTFSHASAAYSKGVCDAVYRNGEISALGNYKYNGQWRNGICSNSTYYGSGPRFEGKIYCIRLYSKQLTDEEVAANYAIDKARFNLP